MMYALTQGRPIGLHRLFAPRRPSHAEAEEAVLKVSSDH
jgi:hypothetical protein